VPQRDATLVALARTFIAKQGFSNVAVIQGDARATGLRRGADDRRVFLGSGDRLVQRIAEVRLKGFSPSTEVFIARPRGA